MLLYIVKLGLLEVLYPIVPIDCQKLFAEEELDQQYEFPNGETVNSTLSHALIESLIFNEDTA